MAAPVAIAVTLSPQREAFAPVAAVAAAPVPNGSSHPAAVEAAEAETLEAKRTAETAAAAALDVAAAAAAAATAASTALDVSATAAAASTALDASDAAADATSAALEAQATSETVSSTLMGIALLAYLQGSAAKHEARGAGGGYGSIAAPSSSQGGLAAARPAAGAGAGAHPYERLPPRRYQRMSPVDTETPTEPLTRMLAAIRASQSKAQYTCKRVLSSSTYLHRVHVNAAMSTNLLPDYGGHASGKTSPRDDENAWRAPTGAPTCRKPNTVIFRRRVRVLDERDREWLITYESLCSAGQRHTRFSAGWATLCKANEFKVGETIVFSRWGKRDSGVVVVQREDCGGAV